MESASIFLISTTIGTIVCEKFGIGVGHSNTIGLLVMTLLSKQEFDSNWFIVIGSILILYWFREWFTEKIFGSKKGNSFVIYDDHERNLIDYMNYFPEFFDKKYNSKMGELYYETVNQHTIVSMDHPQTIYFDDKNFNVKGYLTTISKTIKVSRGKEKNSVDEERVFPLIFVYNNNQGMSASNYYHEIRNIIEEKHQEDPNLYLYYIKYFPILQDSKIKGYERLSYCMYHGLKTDDEKLKKQFMDTFFHQQKQHVFDNVMKVANDPEFFNNFGQAATCNYLLEGPPGSGKSTFAFRLAMVTKRHVLSLDVSMFNNKERLYSTFFQNYKESIILLEEFDIAINNLLERSKEKTNIVLENSKKKKEKDSSYITWMKKFYDTKDEIHLEDLLELLQGPTQRNGQIVIATTNKYDEIKEICPALFRPGRLTVVHFDYLNCEEINKMGKYYFGDAHKDIDFNPEICNARIVEFAITAKINNDPNYFYTQLKLNKNT